MSCVTGDCLFLSSFLCALDGTFNGTLNNVGSLLGSVHSSVGSSVNSSLSAINNILNLLAVSSSSGVVTASGSSTFARNHTQAEHNSK